jgi:hypothetical protein
MWWAGTGSNRRPYGLQPGAMHPAVRLGAENPQVDTVLNRA